MTGPGVTVGLISMPFVSSRSPSLQLGTLAPLAAAAGHPTRTFHFTLDLAALIGVDRYEALCDFGRHPLGDWLFSVAAFRDAAPDPDADYLDRHATGLGPLLRRLRWSADDVRRVRSEVIPAYLDWLTRLVPWPSYQVVGFTSTFQQNLASLALARRVKEVSPGTLVLVGGANTEDEMGAELLRVAPWVDLAVVGEGEQTLPELLDAVAAGRDPTTVRGVAGRRGDRMVPALARPLLTDLDSTPVPDYAEYFERAGVLRLLDPEDVTAVDLPVETSRGCWWGQRHHCTFCGLNGASMTFRAKSPKRAEAELDTLAARHGVRSFMAVDNIMDTGYLTTLLPALAGRQQQYRLFYEIKANLDRSDVRLLAAAGVREVQPGIESLSSAVLTLMRKGVSAAQNINLLRWCRYYGVTVHWNVLYGFPGEPAEAYDRQARLMPALTHLEPPGSVDRIWLERFSPLYREHAARPAPNGLRPHHGYRFLYPASTRLDRIAYFFDHDLPGALPDEVFAGMRAAADAWRQRWRTGPARLEYRPGPAGSLLVEDDRDPATPRRHELDGVLAATLAATVDRPVTRTGLQRRLDGSPPALVAGALVRLGELGLLHDDGRFLIGLPIPAGDPA